MAHYACNQSPSAAVVAVDFVGTPTHLPAAVAVAVALGTAFDDGIGELRRDKEECTEKRRVQFAQSTQHSILKYSQCLVSGISARAQMLRHGKSKDMAMSSLALSGTAPSVVWQNADQCLPSVYSPY